MRGPNNPLAIYGQIVWGQNVKNRNSEIQTNLWRLVG
jgi:hypothetical protein